MLQDIRDCNLYNSKVCTISHDTPIFFHANVPWNYQGLFPAVYFFDNFSSEVLACLSACSVYRVDSIMLVEEEYKVVSVDASDKMLKYALKERWERRKEKAFDQWGKAFLHTYKQWKWQY